MRYSANNRPSTATTRTELNCRGSSRQMNWSLKLGMFTRGYVDIAQVLKYMWGK